MQISLGDSLAAMFAAFGAPGGALPARRPATGAAGDRRVPRRVVLRPARKRRSPEYDRLGYVRGPGGLGLEGIVPSSLFRSRDGILLVIAANSDNLYRRLCAAMGEPERADDPRYATHRARAEHQQDVESAISTWASMRDAAEITETLSAAGVVCGPIYTMAEIFDDPHFREREMLIRHDDAEIGPFTGPGVIPRFSRTPGGVRWSGPWTPGAHNEEVYGGLLGLSGDKLESLREEGVI